MAQLRCAITGANGYVGSEIAGAMARAGIDVLRLQRRAEGESNVRPFSLGDALDIRTLEGVDALVHCAWDITARSWSEIRKTNIDGSLRLFETAKSAGVKRIVFISSMSAFPGCKSLYGQSKLEVEARSAPLGVYSVRPGLVYGDSSGGMVGALNKMASLPVLPLVGGGRQQMNLVHQDDLTRLVIGLCNGTIVYGGTPIIAAHSRPRTLRQILESLAARQHRKTHFVCIPWRPVWLALKIAELLGLRSRLRSDGLVSLMNCDTNPDFRATIATGVEFRDFGE